MGILGNLRKLALVWISGGGGVLVSGAYNIINSIYPFTNYSFINQEAARIIFWISIGVGSLGIALILFSIIIAIISGYKKKATIEDIKHIPIGKDYIKEADEVKDKGDVLVEILTNMHKRMMQLTETQLKHPIKRGQLDDNTPLLLDRLGLVKLDDWIDFRKKIKQRIKRNIPKSAKRREGGLWRYKVIGEAQQIKNELFESRIWQIEDVMKASEWLDDIHLGIGEVRDNDKPWGVLLETLKPYMNADSILRELIDQHMSLSYAYCSTSLIQNYGRRFPKSDLNEMFCSVLVRSNISPLEIEKVLSEIVEKIDNRMKELETTDRNVTNIQNTKIKLDVENSDKAMGMEIKNVQTDLSNTQIDVTAKNVKEATGLSVSATNAEFALSSRVIMCSCGNVIRSVTTCGYKPAITCPKCGKEYKD
jgi:hypothetical protein